MDTSDDIPGRFGLDAGYVSVDGEYVWLGKPSYERHLEVQIQYVETLYRVVPNIRKTLRDDVSEKSGSMSIDDIVKDWKKQYHLDDWVSDKIIQRDGDKWPQVYKWFLDTHPSEEGRPSQFDADKSFTFTVNFFPYLDRLDRLKKLAEKAFQQKWIEFAQKIEEEVTQNGWKHSGKHSTPHKSKTIKRHLEWLARYQSGGESEPEIAATVKSKYKGASTLTDPTTIRTATKNMARDLGISLRNRKE